jgi:hypothetical protein
MLKRASDWTYTRSHLRCLRLCLRKLRSLDILSKSFDLFAQDSHVKACFRLDLYALTSACNIRDYLRSHLRATYATICAHICVQHTRLSALTSALPRPAYARILLLALQVFSHDLYSACFVQVLPSATARIPFAHIGEDLHSLLLVEERIADLIALKLALLFQARTPWQVNRCPCSLYDKLGVPAQKLD